jgi:hypothetical protein
MGQTEGYEAGYELHAGSKILFACHVCAGMMKCGQTNSKWSTICGDANRSDMPRYIVSFEQILARQRSRLLNKVGQTPSIAPSIVALKAHLNLWEPWKLPGNPGR